MEAFVLRMGRAYAAQRNADRGPGAEPTTSALSPYLRRRMLLEQEVVSIAREAHVQEGTKFIEEVVWRTYYKGYLELRPSLWRDYEAAVQAGRDRLDGNAELNDALQAAIAGRTGIDAFDAWARELVEANWLHNHARMWFASIWIFTLRLPWALGADHFLRHLIDGDPASNTLSWRWVAGLHTRGKHYVARADNIRRYTDGRFTATGLDETPAPLDGPPPPPPSPLPAGGTAPDGRVALLLHLDDLHPESLGLAGVRVARVAGLTASVAGAADRVRRFDAAAMADALARAQAHFGCEVVDYAPGWEGGLPIVAAWAPVGPSAAAMPGCVRLRRNWDSWAWPHATRGFFQMRTALPGLVGARRA